MTFLVTLLAGALAVAVAAVVVLAALAGWGGPKSRRERWAYGLLAGGLVWAAPGRFAAGVGMGDVVFLAGLLGVLWSCKGPVILAWLSLERSKPQGLPPYRPDRLPTP